MDAWAPLDGRVILVTGSAKRIGRGIAAFCDAAQWKRMQANGMMRDFSWAQSARDYALIYERITAIS